ncbi:MAG: ATP-binding protein [Chitinophagales bacterium]
MQKNSNKILQSIIHISKCTHKAKIESLTKAALKKNTQFLQKKFNCSTDEAVFFAILFSLYFDTGYHVDVKDVARHLDCDAVELLPYEYHLTNLVKKKLVSFDNDNLQKANFTYRFRKNVIQSILTEKEPEKIELIIDNLSLLRHLRNIVREYTDKEINYAEVEEQINEALQENKKIYFAEKLNGIHVPFELKLFLLYIVIMYYEGDCCHSLMNRLNDIFWDGKRQFDIAKSIVLRNQTVLFEQNILKTTPATWKNDIEIELTQEGTKFLFNEDAYLILIENESNKEREQHVIYSEKIPLKDLYYNAQDLITIDFIHNTLKADNYPAIRNRLLENNMAEGISILMHGKPGTGKTETVMQLAKATGRNIYRVDISKLKSMWFGESQKKIKKLFLDYYEYSEKQTATPILLFNEADGVINKRKDSNSSAVAQTENEIQNIILQEMEEFKGILIATTNLTDNIDTAFERRFLFKLELTVPTPSTRYEIYRSLLPNLNDNELWVLAEDFDFSGGVIQNIVRKATMHHVLNGSYPGVDWYIDACKQEQYKTGSTRTKIGFK